MALRVARLASGPAARAGLQLDPGLAGAGLANALDALVHPPNHLLLGASTAVFVALGLAGAVPLVRTCGSTVDNVVGTLGGTVAVTVP